MAHSGVCVRYMEGNLEFPHGFALGKPHVIRKSVSSRTHLLLHCISFIEAHRRGRPVVVPNRHHVVNHHPAVVTPSEYLVDILSTQVRNMSELSPCFLVIQSSIVMSLDHGNQKKFYMDLI
jgi:hypothetical protein